MVVIVIALIVLVVIIYAVMLAVETESSAAGAATAITNIRRIEREARTEIDHAVAHNLQLVQHLVVTHTHLPRVITVGECCPYRGCPDYRKEQSQQPYRNIRKYGKRGAGRQRYQCTTCCRTFS